MEFIGRLITGDFEDNTMTFEIEGEMTLQAGRYRIVQIEVGNQVKNNVGLAGVVGQGEQLCRCGKPEEKAYSPCCSLTCWCEQFE